MTIDLTQKTGQFPTPDTHSEIAAELTRLAHAAEPTAQVSLISLVGSHGYGLANENSDLDFRGFFQAPARELLGIQNVRDQIKMDTPDFVLFEMRKFVQMALGSNPNVIDILWAPVLQASKPGSALLENRQLFLSESVRANYNGYAYGQYSQALRAEDHDSRAKFLRHAFRVLEQGQQLVETASFDYRLRDPEKIKAMGQLDDVRAEKEFRTKEAAFKAAASVLPEKPDTDRVNDLVIALRLNELS